MPEVGFEPTRADSPADLKSAPLDPSGIQACKCAAALQSTRYLISEVQGENNEGGGGAKIIKRASYPCRDLNPESLDS